MKKSILTLVIVFAFMMTSCGQNDVAMADNSFTVENNATTKLSKSHSLFNTEQKIEARKKSAELLNMELRQVSLSSGINYKNNLFWKVRIKTSGKTKYLFFKANKNFTNVSKKECRLEPVLELAKQSL